MFVELRYSLTILLLPLVIPLGKRLQERIIKLPEAKGNRNGTVGTNKQAFKILSLGESPLAGVGITDQMENLTVLTAEKIHRRSKLTVEWFICAKSGILMRDLYPTFEKTLPNECDLIFVAMGVNDCKQITTMHYWRTNWVKLFNQLRVHYPKAKIICSSVPPMEQFPALSWPLATFLGARSALMNKQLKTIIGQLDNVELLPIPDVLSEDYFAEDFFHPNAKAHQKWSTAIMAKVEQFALW